MSLSRSLLVVTLLLTGARPAVGEDLAKARDPAPLPGTRPLLMTGDIASQMVEGVDRFLLGEIEKSLARRAAYWKRDTSSPEKHAASIEPNRRRLAQILGVRDERVALDALELIGTTKQPALVARGDGYKVFAVRWPAFGDVHGEGLLLVPSLAEYVGDVVAIPDADQAPEMLAGLSPGVPLESQFARRLAESGCRVLVPVLISRATEPRGGARLTNREFVYRSAFELGRHVIGYELQKVLAGIDWLSRSSGGPPPDKGVIGWGEGGMLALYAAALDTRIDVACASGYFGSRQGIWQEPIDRNVFGLLEQFGDAELAAMIAPRTLVVEAARGPQFEIPPGTGGGPGRLVTPELDNVPAEIERAKQLVHGLTLPPRITLVESGDGTGPFGSCPPCRHFSSRFRPAQNWSIPESSPRSCASNSIPYRVSSGRFTSSTATISGCCGKARTSARSSSRDSTPARWRSSSRRSSGIASSSTTR